MPFYRGVSKYLTDEQCWAIVCVDPSVELPQFPMAVGACLERLTESNDTGASTTRPVR